MKVEDFFVHESEYKEAQVTIGASTKIWHFVNVLPNTTIGQYCVMGLNVMAGPHVCIGNGCKLQNNVALYNGVPLADDGFFGPPCVFTSVITPWTNIERKDEVAKTYVGRGATIRANATIVSRNRLGAYCMVAADAVVISDVADYALVAGVPARQIGWVSETGNHVYVDLVCPRTGERYAEEGGNSRWLRRNPCSS